MEKYFVQLYTDILMPLGDIEAAWIIFLQKYYSNRITDILMDVVVLASSLKAYFIFFIVYFIGVKRKKKVFYLLAFMAISVLLNGLLKELIQAPRPYQLYSEIVGKYLSSAGGSSFPSGHSQAIAFLCTFLYLDLREHPFLFFFLVLLVGFSRVYAGVHFPHDVFAGYVLGMSISLLAYALSPFRQKKEKKALL